MPEETGGRSVVDEARAALDEWADMGAVEQMREDASGWVALVADLVEQVEALREALGVYRSALLSKEPESRQMRELLVKAGVLLEADPR